MVLTGGDKKAAKSGTVCSILFWSPNKATLAVAEQEDIVCENLSKRLPLCFFRVRTQIVTTERG